MDVCIILMSVESVFCKFCLRPLVNLIDIYNESHSTCQSEFIDHFCLPFELLSILSEYNFFIYSTYFYIVLIILFTKYNEIWFFF